MDHLIIVVIAGLAILVVLYLAWTRLTVSGNIHTLTSEVNIPSHGVDLTGAAKAARGRLIKFGKRALPALEAANCGLIASQAESAEELEKRPALNAFDHYGRWTRTYKWTLVKQRERVDDVIWHIQHSVAIHEACASGDLARMKAVAEEADDYLWEAGEVSAALKALKIEIAKVEKKGH